MVGLCHLSKHFFHLSKPNSNGLNTLFCHESKLCCDYAFFYIIFENIHYLSNFQILMLGSFQITLLIAQLWFLELRHFTHQGWCFLKSTEVYTPSYVASIVRLLRVSIGQATCGNFSNLVVWVVMRAKPRRRRRPLTGHWKKWQAGSKDNWFL